MADTYTLSWSKKQLQFHIERLSDLLTRNRAAYRDDRALNDYHLLHVGSRQECEAMADSCRGTLHIRRQAASVIESAMRKAGRPA